MVTPRTPQLPLGLDPRLLPVGSEYIRTDADHEVRSPYDDALVATTGWADATLSRRAIDAAAKAMESPIPQHERAALLDRTAALLAQHVDVLAGIVCAEAGKPITAARIEAQRAVETFQAAAVATRTLVGEVVPMDGSASGAGKLGYTLRVPAGVVGAVTPFNFPLNLVSHKVAPALAAGCAVVLKPAEKTPLSSLALARLLREAGLPDGWLNVLVGPAAELVDPMLTDERLRVLSFTGSGPVGWSLRERAGRTKVMLELGNATPVLVLPDADLELAAAKLAGTAYTFAGQSCVSVQRIIVHESVAADFEQRFVERVRAISAGNPADEVTVVGPVIDGAAHDRILEWIREAQAEGAEVVVGGSSLGHNVIEPTVVRGVTNAMRLGCEEVFGPVAALMEYGSTDEAVEIANGTIHGLQAGIFTRDVTHALALAERLEFGGVTVNESPTFRADHMPYGGVKASGTGKEGPAWAVREMTQERLVVLQLT